MRRFYRLDVQPDLFGIWGVVREWGRIGQAGRVQIDPDPSMTEAAAWIQRQHTAKQGRGYVLFEVRSSSTTVEAVASVASSLDTAPCASARGYSSGCTSVSPEGMERGDGTAEGTSPAGSTVSEAATTNLC